MRIFAAANTDCDQRRAPAFVAVVVAAGENHQLALIGRRETTNLDRSGIKLAIGKIEGVRVLAVITSEQRIQLYDPVHNRWRDDLSQTPCRDLLLADLDGDGNDEVYALPMGEAVLHRLDPTTGSLTPVAGSAK